MKDIDLDVFLAIMDGQVTEGDNDTFYVDESGVRSTFAPTVADRAELVRQGHLFSKKTRGGPCDENTKERTGEWQQSEADVLREFANECRFDFPITLDTAMAWAANIISMDPSEVEANYRRQKGEPPGQGKIERRRSLQRIIKAMQKDDPELSIEDMPGTKQDLMEFCQKIDRKEFSIADSTFSDVIKGWIKFGSGRRNGETDYYNNARLYRIKPHLG